MDATECNPHGAQPTLTYEVRLREYPLYSLTESRGLRSPVAPFPQTRVGGHVEAGRRRVRQGCRPLRTTWPGRRREALVLVKGLEAGMPLNVRSPDGSHPVFALAAADYGVECRRRLRVPMYPSTAGRHRPRTPRTWAKMRGRHEIRGRRPAGRPPLAVSERPCPPESRQSLSR